jgi:hypothetical protein
MATDTKRCTVGWQRGWNGGWSNYSDGAVYAGINTQSYYTCILRFTVPEIVGVFENVTFTLGMTKGLGTAPTLRYALCTSDSNKDYYIKTNAAVSEENQITSGTFTTGELKATITYQKLVVPTKNLECGKTYYLFLWGHSEHTQPEFAMINATGNHTITVGYNTGLVYIDNGSGFTAYQAYVDNGTDWSLCIPYIDNGSSWDMYS